MATLYRNKYRSESARLQSWDYANAAMYFVTIVTKNRLKYFGDIPELDGPLFGPHHPGQFETLEALLSEMNALADGNGAPALNGDAGSTGDAVWMGNAEQSGNADQLRNGNRMGNGDRMGNADQLGNGDRIGNADQSENANWSCNADPVRTRCIASQPSPPFTHPSHLDSAYPQNIVQLSHLGKIAYHEWLRTPSIRPDMNLRLGEFMVMPDHFHAILGIGDNPFNSGTNKKSFCINRDVDTFYRNPPESRDRTLIPKENLFLHKNLSVNQFAPQSHNLASVLRGFKSAVTMFARKNKVAFDWQPRFHDHIIRSESEYQRISRYIRNNPAKWRSDQLQKRMNTLARMEY